MRRWEGIRIFRCLAIAVAFASAPAHSSEYVELGVAADYSVGDYGDVQDTDLLFFMVSAKLRTDRWTLRASLPYIHIKGPANFIPTDRGILPDDQPTAVASRAGVGDLAISAERSFRIEDDLFVGIVGRLKVPTASVAKGLGTGTASLTTSAEVTKLMGAVVIAARAGRRFNGSSDRFRQRDVWEAGGSLIYSKGGTALGVAYDWRGKARATSTDRSELTAFVTRTLSQKWRIQAYATVGFSDGSPSKGGGLALLFRLPR